MERIKFTKPHKTITKHGVKRKEIIAVSYIFICIEQKDSVFYVLRAEDLEKRIKGYVFGK